jgi:predicted N-formylglutamate amidohydrolase
VAEQQTEFVEVCGTPNGAPSLLLTCEHASERLPSPWSWPAEDAWLVGTHWAYDLGAADLARELSAAESVVAVLSRFSRLLVDPNRPEHAPDLFRRTAEGRMVALNAHVHEKDKERRMAMFHAFHDAVDREVARSTASVLLAVHTFTPIYEGKPRAVEVGVLFDREEALAERLRAALDEQGFRVEMNEPYSGKQGLMYSVERHAQKHGRRAVELEVRQDLAVDPRARARVIDAVRRCFSAA